MSFKLKPIAEQAPEKTTVAFRLDVELYNRFLSECETAGISVSEGLRQLVEQCCKRK